MMAMMMGRLLFESQEGKGPPGRLTPQKGALQVDVGGVNTHLCIYTRLPRAPPLPALARSRMHTAAREPFFYRFAPCPPVVLMLI